MHESESGDAPPAFPIVGIGASAGGLEAVKDLVAQANETHGMAFIVVQHLAPDHESLMAELVGRATSLRVRQISDGDVIEPNRVYVIPPGRSLTVEGHRLVLSSFEEPRGLRRPIDVLFASLGREHQSNAVCVVLSGTGSDGSAGLRVVKEEGGLCIAQDPDSAGYDGMPTSAMATGLVDYVCAPSTIVERIAAYFARRASIPPIDLQGEVANDIERLCETLLERTGHDFNGYKRSTLVRRVKRRMQLLGKTTSSEYIEFASEDVGECEALFRDLLIHVTSFFRDPAYFETLRTLVIEPLVASAALSDEIRIWVPGCSTGEEAYTLAMLVAEACRERSRRPMIQIFATDISEDMLRIAREGRYPQSALLDIPEALRDRYTIGLDGFFQIAPRIRDYIRFSQHSIIKDPPFSRLDLISCRNLLIYLGDDLQSLVIPILHYSLEQGGHLFLGPSEGISRRADLFTPVDQKARIYARSARAATYPLSLPSAGLRRRRRPSSPETHFDDRPRETPDGFRTVLLDRYTPPSVVLGPDGEILDSNGDLAKYLKLSPGRHALPIGRLARPGLDSAIMPLLREVAQLGARRARRNIEVSSDLGHQTIDLVADPLGGGQTMLVFVDTERFRQDLKEDYATVDVTYDRANELEEELRQTRFRLRNTVEELETANEELKSSNEEMMSMNEELQSANEELSTVNDELKSKVDELGLVNDDLRNFMTSTHLAVIVVDHELRIRSFTREASQIFPLIASDQGRPLTDVSSRVSGADIHAMARRVMASGRVEEVMVEAPDDNRAYQARITPYHSLHDGVGGATLTFNDVTRLRALEREVRDKSERLSLALQIGRLGVWQLDLEQQTSTLDEAESQLFALPSLVPIPLAEVIARLHPDDRARIQQQLLRSIESRSNFDSRFRVVHPDGSIRHLRGLGRRVDETTIVGINYDITEEEEAHEQKSILLLEMNHRVKNLFAVISSLVTASKSGADTVEELSTVLRGRVEALADAHNFTLTREREGVEVDLHGLVQVALKPHDPNKLAKVSGDAFSVPGRHVTPLGLIMHELATNSAKYGVLSVGTGSIEVSWTCSDAGVDFSWTERGVPGPNESSDGSDAPGFGTRLIKTCARQLRGKFERTHTPEGMVARLTFTAPAGK